MPHLPLCGLLKAKFSCAALLFTSQHPSVLAHVQEPAVADNQQPTGLAGSMSKIMAGRKTEIELVRMLASLCSLQL